MEGSVFALTGSASHMHPASVEFFAYKEEEILSNSWFKSSVKYILGWSEYMNSGKSKLLVDIDVKGRKESEACRRSPSGGTVNFNPPIHEKIPS